MLLKHCKPYKLKTKSQKANLYGTTENGTPTSGKISQSISSLGVMSTVLMINTSFLTKVACLIGSAWKII